MTSDSKSMASLRPPVAYRRALTPHQQYMQWTEHHQHQAQGSPPCAIYLWQYLLYKYLGGVPQEIELEEIRFEISEGRSKTYCVQSWKNAIWQHLVLKGLVEVVKQFTQRVLRVVANHAEPIKEIEKRFGKPKFNLHSTKLLCESEPESIEIEDSIQRNSEFTQTPVAVGGGDEEELEEILAAIADASFTQAQGYKESRQSGQALSLQSFDTTRETLHTGRRVGGQSTLSVSLSRLVHFVQELCRGEQSSAMVEPQVLDKFSTPVPRTILERLRDMNIPLSQEVRLPLALPFGQSLVAKTPVAQLEWNISALEEEAATQGLKSPIAAFKYFIRNNCQQSNDRQSWWNSAAVALRKQRRSKLIQAVFEHIGEAVVMFTNGRRLPLIQAQGMSWEAITALGDEP